MAPVWTELFDVFFQTIESKVTIICSFSFSRSFMGYICEGWSWSFFISLWKLKWDCKWTLAGQRIVKYYLVGIWDTWWPAIVKYYLAGKWDICWPTITFLRLILIPLFLCENSCDCKYFCGVDLWVLKMQYYLEMCAYIEDVYSLEFHVK